MRAAFLFVLAALTATLALSAPTMANSPEPCTPLASVCAPQPDALLLCRWEPDDALVVQEVRVVTGKGTAPAVGSKVGSLPLSALARQSYGCKQGDASVCTGSMLVYAWWASGVEMRRAGTIHKGRFAPWSAPHWCSAPDAEKALQALAMPVFSCEARMNELEGDDAIGSGCGAGAPGRGGAAALVAWVLATLILMRRRVDQP